MFIGPHRAGKTKLADSICGALEGTTVSLETEQGMNFILSSFNDEDNGLCILEDVSYTSLKDVMDKRMRTHLDGTRMTQNPKYKGTRTAACPPFLTTTNVAFGLSSSPEKLPYVRQYRQELHMPAPCRYTQETSTVSRSLTHPEHLLVGRRNVLIIPRVLDEYCMNGVMHTFAPKPADFIDFLMVRYVPACALLFGGTPCTFSPCHGDAYSLSSHHVSCRWICQLACDANDDDLQKLSSAGLSIHTTFNVLSYSADILIPEGVSSLGANLQIQLAQLSCINAPKNISAESLNNNKFYIIRVNTGHPVGHIEISACEMVTLLSGFYTQSMLAKQAILV